MKGPVTMTVAARTVRVTIGKASRYVCITSRASAPPPAMTTTSGSVPIPIPARTRRGLFTGPILQT